MNDCQDTALPSLKVAIACGGTGGHLFPGVAIADVLQQNGHEAFLILSDKKVDQAASDSIKHPYITLPSVAWQKGKRLAFLTGFPKVLSQCRKQFKERRPDAVLAMGGFTSLAPVLAARQLRKSVFLHESNAFPGKAIRMLARWADMGFVGFEKTIHRISRVPCQVTGTPVRESFRQLDREACCQALGFQSNKPVLLVTGGSQGALAINRLVLDHLTDIKQSFPELQILHLCGLNEDLDHARSRYQHHGITAQVHAFFDRMDLALGAATAAIGRSGASFMAELVAARLPSMLIPFPGATDNHQLENALSLSELGAAIHFDEKKRESNLFIHSLDTLLRDSSQRQRMQKAMIDMDYPNAAEVIVSHMCSVIGCGQFDVPVKNVIQSDNPAPSNPDELHSIRQMTSIS